MAEEFPFAGGSGAVVSMKPMGFLIDDGKSCHILRISDDALDNFDKINALDYKLAHLDYKFIDSLTHYTQRMEFTSVQCYTAAGIDKKLYSKIKNNPNYLPSKSTIIKFAFALHLSLAETQQLLGTCGYILSDSLAEDVIVKHFLTQRIYELEKLQEEFLKRSL